MRILILLLTISLPFQLFSQQISDTNYKPTLENPEYNLKKGPIVFIDEGHCNFHKKEGKYKPFSNLLENDGYNVTKYIGTFKPNKLSEGKILVISNALNAVNEKKWKLPTPSAFSKEEINILEQWVSEGGSLFLIADHMPMAGAAKDLAAKFGFVFTNGFVFHKKTKGVASFTIKDGSLNTSIITTGRNSAESISQIKSFTGQAFKIPNDATPILLFNKEYLNYLPEKAWDFTKNTPRNKVNGWSQGAFKKHGKGKIVVFGEAAMFSAQLAGDKKIKVGMNNEEAPENYQLLLNIIHWLDGKME